ncbi:MAG TPA: hypothetical protein VFX49_06950 [Chloroflexota bacterium]|nr:hypothetical protein [Chloroflexota bacterium]
MSENELTPVARMMMSVAGHAITSYVQFRALAEILIQKGILTREELEQQFTLMRDDGLDRTVDEWFEPDIAYHLKMAIKASRAGQTGD